MADAVAVGEAVADVDAEDDADEERAEADSSPAVADSDSVRGENADEEAEGGAVEFGVRDVGCRR